MSKDLQKLQTVRGGASSVLEEEEEIFFSERGSLGGTSRGVEIFFKLQSERGGLLGCRFQRY